MKFVHVTPPAVAENEIRLSIHELSESSVPVAAPVNVALKTRRHDAVKLPAGLSMIDPSAANALINGLLKVAPEYSL